MLFAQVQLLLIILDGKVIKLVKIFVLLIGSLKIQQEDVFKIALNLNLVM